VPLQEVSANIQSDNTRFPPVVPSVHPAPASSRDSHAPSDYTAAMVLSQPKLPIPRDPRIAILPPKPTTTLNDIILSKDPILYNEVYQIFICRRHGYVITNLSTHLRNQHQELPLSLRRQLIEKHQHQVIVKIEEVLTPPPNSPPIEGLSAPIPAFQCNHPRCEWVSSHSKSIEQHAREQHHWRVSQGRTYWTPVFAQTWWTSGGKRRYFRVQVSDDYQVSAYMHSRATH
jgi:hypothetical protein